MPGTRIDTLAALRSWADSSETPRIFWLSGMAGIGKSAIAMSFCKTLDAEGRLGGSFFCSRQNAVCSDVGSILPSIAFQLAHHLAPYRRRLVEYLKQRLELSYSSIPTEEQMKHLLVKVLGTDDREQLKSRRMVIVIDALDECSSSAAVQNLIEIILSSEHLGFNLLVTSRPEAHLERGFSYQTQDQNGIVDHFTGNPSSGFISFRLHAVETNIAESDILLYLQRSLAGAIATDQDEEIGMLARKSGRLFIYAFIAFQYIKGSGLEVALTRQQRQRRFLTLVNSELSSKSSLQTKDVNDLYQYIFATVYQGKESDEIEDIRSVLDSLLCLFTPLSLSNFSLLLADQEENMRDLLIGFQSVLEIPLDVERQIVAFHASFSDYVMDSQQSKAYCLKSRHLSLSLKCLKTMNKYLHQDICHLRRRQVQLSDVPLAILQRHVPGVLDYSCRFWASHLERRVQRLHEDEHKAIIAELEIFTSNHLFHWVECLGLINALHFVSGSVHKAQKYLMVSWSPPYNLALIISSVISHFDS